MSQAVQAKQADRLKKLRDLHIKRVSIIFFNKIDYKGH